MDGTAEDEREEQHEHQRLKRDVDQLLGDLPNVLDVAPGEHHRVGRQGREPGLGRLRRLLDAASTGSCVSVAVMRLPPQGRDGLRP